MTTDKKRSIKGAGIIASIVLFIFFALYLGSNGIPNELFRDSDNNETVSASANDELVVHFLDVGQGDSTFIELPDGKCMLIDTGTVSNAESVISTINGLGYGKLDYFLISHPHDDHMGGAEQIIEKLEIGKLYMPKIADEDIPTASFYMSFLEAVSDNGIKLTRAKPGISFSEGGATAEFFAPINQSYSSMNDYSAGIKLTYGKTSFVFFGDAGTLAEHEVLDSGFDVEADVLKVSHHGSNSSSSLEFIRAVGCRYAVISVGKGNSYGHPSEQTLSYLSSVGAEYYRTDTYGDITMISDGSNIEVEK